MKEFPFNIKEGLTKGLRRFSTNPINSQFLVELHNLAPSDQGLEPHETMTSMNATGVTWGGVGAKDAAVTTVDITISIVEYVDEDVDVAGASVYIDNVYAGITDADGELDVTVTKGGHTIKVVALGYTDTDVDGLINDYFTA